MALFSLSVQYVGRTKRLTNAVLAAAYRAGARLRDDRTGLTHNFSAKRVETAEILAPSYAPEWVRDRSALWNACEAQANHPRAITARELRIALPRELSREQQLELVRTFLREEFVALGMVADWSLHDAPDNSQPRVHVMLTLRELGPDGFGNKVAAWNKKKLLYRWREEWARHANRALELAGHEERIDHRSYKDRGIDIEPQPKLYRHAEQVQTDGRAMVHERRGMLGEVTLRNGERMLRDPSGPIRALAAQGGTFTRKQLRTFVEAHAPTDALRAACMDAVLGCTELLELPTGRYALRGSGLHAHATTSPC